MLTVADFTPVHHRVPNRAVSGKEGEVTLVSDGAGIGGRDDRLDLQISLRPDGDLAKKEVGGTEDFSDLALAAGIAEFTSVAQLVVQLGNALILVFITGSEDLASVNRCRTGQTRLALTSGGITKLRTVTEQAVVTETVIRLVEADVILFIADGTDPHTAVDSGRTRAESDTAALHAGLCPGAEKTVVAIGGGSTPGAFALRAHLSQHRLRNHQESRNYYQSHSGF